MKWQPIETAPTDGTDNAMAFPCDRGPVKTCGSQNGRTAPVDPAKQALASGRASDSALARIKASTHKKERGREKLYWREA